jgi:outer membrane cobalamin receptor
MEIGAGISLVGKRWVRDYSQPDNMKKLDPVIDANLSLNYHYSKLLTVFANLYNLSERSYEIWNQYPSQRFNFIIGFSYKL